MKTTFIINRKPRDKLGRERLGAGTAGVGLTLIFSGHGGDGGGELRLGPGSWVSQPRLFDGFRVPLGLLKRGPPR